MVLPIPAVPCTVLPIVVLLRVTWVVVPHVVLLTVVLPLVPLLAVVLPLVSLLAVVLVMVLLLVGPLVLMSLLPMRLLRGICIIVRRRLLWYRLVLQWRRNSRLYCAMSLREHLGVLHIACESGGAARVSMERRLHKGAMGEGRSVR